ncbi:Ig domain-containing protein [Actinoplanes sp. DH11]|uniref:Ig domain-containing protein n=1 Tax=Actinoplanes sp. DH11 TaxID=2857011 RepID=UPI001E5B8261|nr:Ig domain-containing protein [Actinoplanes sp. DH11]
MRRPAARRGDEGATLIELVVALAVVSVAMAGLGAFFINGTLVVANQRDQRQAVQVAASAIEQVRALEGSSLLAGRGPAKSKAQWDAVRQGPFAKKMKPYLDSMALEADPEIVRKDPGSLLGAEAAISTEPQKVTVGSVTFDRNILVGRCDVYFMRNDDCVNPGVGTPPSNTAEILKYFRVVVLVSWPNKACTAGRCSHIASTLISEAAEPTFGSKAAYPKLVTTEMTFYVGHPVTQRIDADYGQLPNVFGVSPSWPAPLPSWLAMTPGGYVTGAPTALVPDSSNVVRVTDKRGWWAEQKITWKVVAPPAVVIPDNAGSYLNQPVKYQVTATGGVKKYVFTAAQLPDGLEIATDGTITGTLPALGTYPITVTVEDANGIRDTKTFQHTVYEPLTLTAPANQKVVLGAAASGTAVAKGGDGAYAYTATGLPAGVTIDGRTGVVSGTPLLAGTYTPVISVSDGAGGPVTAGYQLVVEAATTLTFTSPNVSTPDQQSAVGDAVNLPLTTNADLLLLRNVSFTVTGLPPGLKVNNGKDAITGTPTEAGAYLVTATADSKLPLPQTTTITFVWTVS